jgi:predicted lactoylglutathione lyase
VPIDHVKLRVSDLDASRAFYAAALAPFGYYAAFVLDPDGHNIEAVYHGEEPRRESAS